MTSRNEATERQVMAAQPNASTWLAANAGSGKTRVLTDRVARLLLDGTEPQRILCLTYTKAAASEMQNRLFARLGDWAMRPDEELREALLVLGVDGPLTSERIREARTLFARAIETPGGLKIQTIHSFCASLLRRFPLEAGVSPNFIEVEDRAAALLRADIVDNLAQGSDAAYIEKVAQYASGDDLEDILNAILKYRTDFSRDVGWAEIAHLFGISADLTEDDIVASVFTGEEADLCASLVEDLQLGSSSDKKAAQILKALQRFDHQALPLLEGLFLTGAGAQTPFKAKMGEVRSKFPTKAVREASPDLIPHVEAWMQRTEDARPNRIALAAAQKTWALHQFARLFLPAYTRGKQLRGWLDFDDLILKARNLLSDPAVASWVLFRLDGGIDHILVDEAQDTSPAQWDVIEKLAQEFTSGQGAREDVERTIFVVGDKKQSIYSFQGADAAAFDRMHAEFGNRLGQSGTALQSLTLDFSFRSADAILRLVDNVFTEEEAAGFPKDSQHRAFKDWLPGRVDLWPIVPAVNDEEDRAWDDPVDRRSPQHHNVILADRIAGRIRKMLDEEETIPDERNGAVVKRPVKAGDFLILVQRRSDLFEEIIRACKANNVPIAGADRLKVGAELAVRDLAALLRFLATPEDSLSLAIVLRSPLFGWTEQELFSLAHHRDTPFLWQALRQQMDTHPETLGILNDLRANTDFLRPYDLIERVLTRHSGRRRMLARLGAEAEDGINALLSQALAYERNEAPSLSGFLGWMETDDLEIKRQIDSAGDLVRVMTVHGAKGLEAPIVMLPDTAKRQPPRSEAIVKSGDLPIWSVPKDVAPQIVADAQEQIRIRSMQERLRLLYVALTRAEKWLIIGAAGAIDEKGGDSWYQRAETGLRAAGAVTLELPGGEGLRLANGEWDDLPMVPAKTLPEVFEDLPEWIGREIDELPAPIVTVSPSDLGGPKALPVEAGQDDEAAKTRGSQIHLLLEHLPAVPKDKWSDVARYLFQECQADMDDVIEEAIALLETPDLQWCFDQSALVEVPVTATLGSARVHGTIDRLILAEDHVLAIDFKTNAVVPDTPQNCPEGLLRQMGAYSHALQQVYPDRRVDVAILWTRNAELMRLPHNLVMDSLSRTPYLDGIAEHS